MRLMLHVHRTVTRSSKEPDDSSAPCPFLIRSYFIQATLAKRQHDQGRFTHCLSETFAPSLKNSVVDANMGASRHIQSLELGQLVILQSSSCSPNSSTHHIFYQYVIPQPRNTFQHARHLSNSFFSPNIYPQIPQFLKLLSNAKPSHHSALRGRIRIYYAAYTCIQPQLENATPALYDSGLA